MTLLKYIDKTTLLMPYEQLYIRSYHHHKQLIPEQHISEHNRMFRLIYNLHNMSHPTWLTDQYSNINTKTSSIPILPTASQHERMTYTNCCVYRAVPPDDEQ